jgi:Ca-activated chloride channel homolog
MVFSRVQIGIVMSELMHNLQDFHFLRPHWLWALIPLMGIVLLLTYVNKQQTGWQSVLAGHLYKHLISHSNAKKLKQPFGLLGLGWILATLAMAGPTWQRLPQPVYQLNTGKVVLMDMSMSMRATDIKPNRLTRAKYKAIDLVKKLTEGEIGLVAYAGDAFTISPLSTDGQNLTTLIPSLSPEIMPIPGSDPILGLQTAIDLLKNANYQQGEIFWITDGVENSQLKELYTLLNSSNYRLSILAVGTEEGAPVQSLNGELLKDSYGAIVLPKLPSDKLKSLAKQGGGRYAALQTDDSDLDYLINQTQLDANSENAEQEEANEKFGDKWQEMGPYLLLLLLPFAAYAFRKGLLPIVLLGLMLPLYTPRADAGWWQDMWTTQDQQGLNAYQNNEFANAAEKFQDPMWQGSAFYKKQEYENALQSFSKVDNIDGRYNQANTLAQLGKLPEAIKMYENVLSEQADYQDAQANKALLEKLLEQQKQQQQDQQSDNSNNDQQQEQNNKDDSSAQNQQDQQDQKGQKQDPKQQDSENNDQKNQQDSSDKENQQQQKSEQQSKESEQQTQAQQQDEQAQGEQSKSEQESKEADDEAKQSALSQQTKELTDEEKEQMQRMQTLLNRVPDDPAFLLKRKMQIEAQQRKRERVPSNLQRNW